MNFVAEILASADEANVLDLKENVSDLSKKISSLKLQVKDVMEKRYVKLLPAMGDNTHLLDNVVELSDVVKDLQVRLDTQVRREVANFAEELKFLSQSFHEVTLSTELVHKLLLVENALKLAKSEFKRTDYYKASQELFLAKSYINEDCPDLELIDLFVGLSCELIAFKENFYLEVMKEFHTSMKWESYPDSICTTVYIRVTTDKNSLENILKTLNKLGVCCQEVSTFSRFLLKDILIRIIEKDCDVIMDDKMTVACLSLMVNETNKKSHYSKVLHNLQTVFLFLHTYLNVYIDDKTSLIKEIGAFSGNEFLNCLVESCLTETIPLKRDLLSNYPAVMEEISAFEKLIRSQGYLPEDNTVLDEYCGNVEELFLSKMIESFLGRARVIVKKDMHDMREVEPISPMREAETFNEMMKEQGVEFAPVCPDMFQFPACCISNSVDEILSLVREILGEIVKGNSEAVQLFDTARSIFTLYLETVPFYHGKLLEKIPQQSALLHNNCWYLSHQIVSLEAEFKTLYPSSLQYHLTQFTDFIEPLRSLGVSTLDKQIQVQKEQLLSILKDSGLSSLSEHEALPEETDKCMRQCIYQLDLLQSVWQKVLPSSIYVRVIGLLSNLFIDEIIKRVIMTKDIRADVTTELVKVFTNVQEKIPLVFPEPLEIHRHVKSWAKFNELVRVLEASLVEISERWAGGKGPLADEFTSEQVRQLIRALFRVSDRRAAILSKIN